MKTKNFIVLVVTTMLLTMGFSSCRIQKVEPTTQYGSTIYKEKQEGSWVKCRVCKGDGNCISCKGKGKIKGKTCQSCSGTGHCTTCEGQGGFRSE